jgi:hypothetical protein
MMSRVDIRRTYRKSSVEFFSIYSVVAVLDPLNDYRRRWEYGGLKLNQARRLKMLEQENARLKRAVADLTLDKLILKETAEGNF